MSAAGSSVPNGHGDDLPHFCKLVMPTGGEWRFRPLNLSSGCHFCDGWSDFMRGNRIRHSDFITFTHVRGGVFNVKRYDFGSGCPPRDDHLLDNNLIEISIADVGEYRDAMLSPDIDSKDDYPPSKNGFDEDSSEDYIAYRSVPRADEYPSFNVVLKKSILERTLEIPLSFWRAHLHM
ncbi:B3 domain-containing protein REM1-like [Salvia divinorum]|uniref:B3 domain-containing protein REM1-like n=1 Tax=Salvia divinorum TaxID=28513 RepID=A0ABD1I3J9_SALDI